MPSFAYNICTNQMDFYVVAKLFSVCTNFVSLYTTFCLVLEMYFSCLQYVLYAPHSI